MIAESTFSSVFGAPVAGGDDSLVHIARAAVREGYAIVPCKPGTKVPLCTLSSREVKRANDEAREQARVAGSRRWDRVRHACGIHHAITEGTVSDRVLRRLLKTHGRINLGVELGRSRVVVVDVDTLAEDVAFKESWLAATGDMLPHGLTVQSPGVVGEDPADWKHKDGGHYWFSVPEGIDLPPGNGALKTETGWVVMWADRQVLVPPSVRPEGPYRLAGDIHPLPKWLLVMILEHAVEKQNRDAEIERRRQERASGVVSEDVSIDEWSAETPWADLLEPDDWVRTGLPDTCGCDVWTAPGVHASPKSATAHDVGCARYDDSLGHAPLHVWTDNPPDWLLDSGKTFTKIQYVALRNHGGTGNGEIQEACRTMGLAKPVTLSPLTGLGADNPALMKQALSALEPPQTPDRPPDPLPSPSASSEPTQAPALGVLGQSPVSAPGSVPTGGPPPQPERPTPEQIREKALAEETWKRGIWAEADRLVWEERYPFAAKMAVSGFHCALDDYDEVMESSRQFLIAGWLPEHSDIALGAEYKAGKTFIAMDTAVSIVSGSKFLDTFEVPVSWSVALMIGEANKKDWYQKITAICVSRGLDVRAVLARLYVKFGAWKLDDPRMVENVYEQCHRIEDLGLIIIDPWYLAAGAADGKTLSVMGDVLSNLTGLRSELNTSLMITTHWNQTGQGKGFNRWTGNGLQEWGRTLINVALDGRVEGPAPYSMDKTGLTTARLSIVLKGETAGSYRAVRSVHRDDARDLDTAIHYTISAEEYAYDEDAEMTPAEKNQLAEERKSDLVLLKVLTFIGAGAAKPPTERQVIKGKMGPDSGSPASRKAQLDIAIAEGWVEASGKMAPALKGGKIQHDPADPEKGNDTLVLTRAGQDKRRRLENPHAPFMSLGEPAGETVEE